MGAEQSVGELRPLDPITMERLLGGIPSRPDFTRESYIEDGVAATAMYKYLAYQDLTPFVIEGESVRDFVVCGPRINGRELNGLLYFPAPYKFYGFDLDDIVKDWTDLFRLKKFDKVLAAHRKMPGWEIFESSRIPMLSSLRSYQQRLIQKKEAQFTPEDYFPRKEVFIPVMRWKVDSYGNRRWIFDLNEDGVLDQLMLKYGKQVVGPEMVSGLVGEFLMASYSPEVTRKWPASMDYMGHARDEEDGGRVMGPTQAPELLIRKTRELVAGSRIPWLVESYHEDPERFSPFNQMVEDRNQRIKITEILKSFNKKRPNTYSLIDFLQ